MEAVLESGVKEILLPSEPFRSGDAPGRVLGVDVDVGGRRLRWYGSRMRVPAYIASGQVRGEFANFAPALRPEFSSMNTAPLRFAVVGLGHIERRQMIAVRLDANSWRAVMCGTEATGVADDLELYTDMASMLAAHPELDVVCICTPNGLHARPFWLWRQTSSSWR